MPHSNLSSDPDSPQLAFRRAMTELRRKAGPDAEAAAMKAFASIATWIGEVGHGNCQLNCVNHLVGSKIRIESIVETRPGVQ